MTRLIYFASAVILIVGLCILPERRTGRVALDLLGFALRDTLFHLAYIVVALCDTIREVVTGAPKYFLERYQEQVLAGIGSPMQQRERV